MCFMGVKPYGIAQAETTDTKAEKSNHGFQS